MCVCLFVCHIHIERERNYTLQSFLNRTNMVEASEVPNDQFTMEANPSSSSSAQSLSLDERMRQRRMDRKQWIRDNEETAAPTSSTKSNNPIGVMLGGSFGQGDEAIRIFDDSDRLALLGGGGGTSKTGAAGFNKEMTLLPQITSSMPMPGGPGTDDEPDEDDMVEAFGRAFVRPFHAYVGGQCATDDYECMAELLANTPCDTLWKEIPVNDRMDECTYMQRNANLPKLRRAIRNMATFLDNQATCLQGRCNIVNDSRFARRRPPGALTTDAAAAVAAGTTVPKTATTTTTTTMAGGGGHQNSRAGDNFLASLSDTELALGLILSASLVGGLVYLAVSKKKTPIISQ